jgi:hypothetical protein
MESQVVLALIMARMMEAWRLEKADRFQERMRWRHVVRKSGGSWWYTESMKSRSCSQWLVVFGGEN